MASYTDKMLPFNPYIQQLPIEAMVKVGMEKQRRYDEGYQKIQTQIDNVAGLDVIRDVDKKYLESSLNQLGNNLRTVTAGDFSNYQLVNSTAGMVTQIGKDQNIQNAVYSTSNHKKQMLAMEEAKKKGELTPENEDNYLRQFSIYAQSPKVGEQFNGKYVDFFDVDKFTRETFNALKPDGLSYDNVFQVGDDGKNIVEEIKDLKTGKISKRYVLSTAMTRLEKDGTFPPKVKETLDRIFSDPRVGRQLQISGEYNYKGFSPVQLAEKVTQNKIQQLGEYDNALKEMNIKLSVATDEADKKILQENIDKITENKNKVVSQYDNLISTAATNPDAIRGLLYKEDTRGNYTGMYTNIKEKRTTLENPVWKANFDMQKEANDLTMRKEDMRYKWASLAQDNAQFNTKLKYELSKDAGQEKLPIPGANPSDVDMNSIFDDNYDKAVGVFGTVTDEALIASGVIDKNVVDAYSKEFPGIPLEKVRATIIKNAAKKEGISVDEFRTKWSLAVIEKLNTTQNLSGEMLSKKTSLENARKLYLDHKGYKQKIDSQFPSPDQQVKDGISSEEYMIDGKPVTFTPQMQYDLALFYHSETVASSKNLQERGLAAKRRLIEKGIPVTSLYTDIKFPRIVPTEESLKNRKLLRDAISQSEGKDYTEKRAKAIKQIYSLNPTLKQDVLTGKPEEIAEKRQALGNMIGDYVKENTNLSHDFKKKSAAMMGILDSKEGSVEVQTRKDEVTGAISPVVYFYGKDAELKGEMTITTAQAERLGMNVNSWYMRPEVKSAEMRVKLTGNSTTSFGDIKSLSTYREGDVIYNKQDFKGLRNIPQNVSGNIKETTVTNADGSQNTVYFNYLYVYDNGKEYLKAMPIPKPSMDEALQFFDGITPQMIEAIISKK